MRCDGIRTMRDSIRENNRIINDTIGHFKKRLVQVANQKFVGLNLPDNTGATVAMMAVYNAVSDTVAAKIALAAAQVLAIEKADSLAIMDTIHTYYATKKALTDTAAAIRAAFPTVNDATLTIKNGVHEVTFSANSSENKVVDIAAISTQSDWNETNPDTASYIKNKPVIKDSVNKVVLDSLSIAGSAINQAVDTIAANIAAHAIHDSIVNNISGQIHDSITHNVYDGQLTLITKTDQGADTTRFTANQAANDTLDFSKIYTTLDSLKAYYDTTNVQKVIADSLKALRDSLLKTADNTLLPQERSKKFTLAADQTDDTYTFTIDSDPHASYLVKIYINGVLVGDNGGTNVLSINDPNRKEIIYNSSENEGYKLEQGDKVILYWFTNVNTSSNAGSGNGSNSQGGGGSGTGD